MRKNCARNKFPQIKPSMYVSRSNPIPSINQIKSSITANCCQDSASPPMMCLNSSPASTDSKNSSSYFHSVFSMSLLVLVHTVCPPIPCVQWIHDIIFVHKFEDKPLIRTYRPTSLSSCISKVLERIIFSHSIQLKSFSTINLISI